MEEYTFEQVWPKGIREISELEVLGLPNKDFAKLCLALKDRLVKFGHTQQAAGDAVRVLRKIRSKDSRASLSMHEHEMLRYEFRESPLLDSFFPKRERKWIKPDKRKLTTSVSASDFSFVDHPRETLKTLAELVRFESIAKAARFNFLDRRVLDISPFILLGMLSRRMAPYIAGGKISGPAQKVFEAVELRDFLGIEPFSNQIDRLDVWPFPLQQRHRQTSTSPEAGDSIGFQKLADNLVDTVNEWLAALPTPRTLSCEAMAQISDIATETLNNAERHSKSIGTGDWVVAGFMARRIVEQDDEQVSSYQHEHWYDCHLAFVNRGRPICEAVVTTPNKEILTEIREYQTKHKSNPRNGSCSPETLATVFAMQDDISSKPENAGGKGMMTIVEFINAVSLTEFPRKAPKMTVISGQSCVMFSGDYSGVSRAGKERAGRTQLFNCNQSIEIAPCAEHVFDLDVRFPGTIIATRFTLDPDTMEALNDDP